MVKLGAPLDVKPMDAMLALARATIGHVVWLHTEIGRIDDLSDPEARVLVHLYDSERDRYSRIAKVCSEMGVEESVIRVQEKEAGLMADAVDKAITKLGLPDAQRRAFHLAIAEELDQADALARSGSAEAIFSGRRRKIPYRFQVAPRPL